MNGTISHSILSQIWFNGTLHVMVLVNTPAVKESFNMCLCKVVKIFFKVYYPHLSTRERKNI